jgi:hypothetical protein
MVQARCHLPNTENKVDASTDVPELTIITV